jgi:phosphomevalonate kinase
MPESSEHFSVLAPGKLLILGEYAVLDGAPALVLAIDRGVRCDVVLGPRMRVETPDGDRSFVDPALIEAPPGTYRFSDWNPVQTSEKTGFGGSAAACVAACLAAGRPAIDALAIHHRVQGSGSGADVAASIAGGMIRFQQGAWEPCPPVEPLVIWSGIAARTGPRVARYLAWQERRDFVEESSVLVEAFSESPIAALREASALLRVMARSAGLDYLNPALERIRELAEHYGGSAKPSGAGGGDSSIALLPDVEAEGRFLDHIGEEGLMSIPVKPAKGAHRSDPATAG